MDRKKPTYEELEARLKEADDLVEVLRDQQVDAIVGKEQVMLVRLKELQENLLQSEEKYRELVNTSIDGIISVDTQMKIVLWNPGAERIFGYTQKEMLGQSLLKIVPERYRKATENGFTEFRKTGTGPVIGEILELEGLRRDGTEIAIELSVSSRRVYERHIATAITRDITERKKAVEALQREKEKVLTKSRELEATQKELVDRALEAGYAQMASMVLHNIGNAITPVIFNLDKIREQELDRCIDFLKKNYADLSKHRLELNRYVNEDASGRAVFDYMGELIEWIKKERTRQIDRIDKISIGIRHAGEILSLQQLYTAKKNQLKERVNLNRLISDVLTMEKDTLSQRGIVVKRLLDADIPSIVIDKAKFMQVLLNIVKNSYEAIDEMAAAIHAGKKEIRFKTTLESGSVKLEIADTGIGIDPAVIGSVFDFGISSKGGSGFGLNFCKRFIESNNGRLSIHSEGKGKGATITLEVKMGSHL